MSIDQKIDLEDYNEKQTKEIKKMYEAYCEENGHVRRYDYIVHVYIRDGYAENFRQNYLKNMERK